MIRFHPLTPAVVERDHAALMRDIPALRAWSAQDWPTPSFSIAENLLDLQRHDREHRDGIAFTYSVVLDESIIGCIYVRPLGDALRTRDVAPPADTPGLHDTVVRGWAHDISDDLLVSASLEAHGGDFGADRRRWWQTNTDCPSQLTACDRLGLADDLRFGGPTATWVLRAVPE